MEDFLDLYGLPLDEKGPVICFDELPVQLVGDVVSSLPMKAGSLAQAHDGTQKYVYEDALMAETDKIVTDTAHT
jgi:hypothetical protein